MKVSQKREFAPMLRLIVVFALAVSCISEASGKPKQAITGIIKEFVCGDNCYLTITINSGNDETGLCVAKQCIPWNKKTTIPKDLIGKRVEVTLGVGVQLDGDYHVVGHALAFTNIRFIR